MTDFDELDALFSMLRRLAHLTNEVDTLAEMIDLRFGHLHWVRDMTNKFDFEKYYKLMPELKDEPVCDDEED